MGKQKSSSAIFFQYLCVGLVLALGIVLLWKFDYPILLSVLVIAYNVVQVLLLCMFLYVYLPILVFVFRKSTLSKLIHGKTEKQPVPVPFLILIPAHNEAILLPTLLESIHTQNYPKEYFNTIVIADNCIDTTADIARLARVQCYERKTNVPSNKTQALRFVWELFQSDPKAYENVTIVLVDADCQLEPDFLLEVSKKKGEINAATVFQSFRYVRNAKQSKISLLDGASEALRQWVILGSRKVLGLQSFLCGSGVVMPYAVFSQLMENEHQSVVEDRVWQGYLLKKNIRTDWCPGAKLNYEVVETHQDFQKQRKRWIGGQLSLGKRYGGEMMVRGILEGNFSKIDYALSLLQLPRAAMMAAACIVSLFAYLFPAYSLFPWWVMCALGMLFVVYFALGLLLINAKLEEYLAVLEGPKIILGLVKSTFYGIIGKRTPTWEATRDLPKSKPTKIKELR